MLVSAYNLSPVSFPWVYSNYSSREEMTLLSSPYSYPIFDYGFQLLLGGCSSAL